MPNWSLIKLENNHKMLYTRPTRITLDSDKTQNILNKILQVSGKRYVFILYKWHYKKLDFSVVQKCWDKKTY